MPDKLSLIERLRAEGSDLSREAADDLERRDASFDLRWNADMRAIKRWQAATGRSMTWPDHADLVVWLLEQLEAGKQNDRHRNRDPGVRSR